MTGGHRTGAGRKPEPMSARSDKRGISFRILPREGYSGPVPACPLPEVIEREQQVWEQLWTSPQASVWAEESWRHRTLAQYVRWSVRMEARDCPASVVAGVLRMADQLGLSPAGMRENCWVLGDVEPVVEQPAPVTSLPQRRMRSVPTAPQTSA